jgi:hypothetical protein
MLNRKLLKTPVRVLLLTFVLSARMTGAAPAAAPHISPPPAHASRPAATVSGLSAIEGIQRWGLNE